MKLCIEQLALYLTRFPSLSLVVQTVRLTISVSLDVARMKLPLARGLLVSSILVFSISPFISEALHRFCER